MLHNERDFGTSEIQAHILHLYMSETLDFIFLAYKMGTPAPTVQSAQEDHVGNLCQMYSTMPGL